MRHFKVTWRFLPALLAAACLLAAPLLVGCETSQAIGQRIHEADEAMGEAISGQKKQRPEW